MTDNPHYVTPEEAKEKICPLKPNQMSIWCEGPKCMAWQWGKELVECENAPFLQDKMWRNSTTHGYCGMVRS
jgi:hypothetical protein